MKHVPSVIKALESKKLSALKRLLSGRDSLAYRELAQECVESVMKSIISTKPAGVPTDYYDWGYRQGLLEAHRMYRALLEHVTDELENREQVDAEVKAE